jgi:peptide/nickel transport system substrate-binding protein
LTTAALRLNFFFLHLHSRYSIALCSAAALIMMLLSSCSVRDEGKNKKVFHLNISTGYLESLDPAYAKDLNMMWIDHMLYNTLVETDEHLHTIPSLAKSWQVSGDGLVYTFHLRTDVYFHDNPEFAGGRGRKMVAADVVYSYGRIIDAKTASPGAWIFNGHVATLNPFIAADDSTFQVILKSPFRPLPELLSMSYCNIVPHEVAERWGKDFRSHPCGTGPFRFKYWDEGNALDLLRNDRYWEHDSGGKALPYLDAVQISFVDSKASEFLLFQQGKVDFVNGIDGSSKDLILSKDGKLKKEYLSRFRMEKSTYLNTEYIGFLTDTTSPEMADEPTRDPRIRRAINYAINRQKIVTYFKNGVGKPATEGFIPAGMPGYDSAATYGYHYDPARALQLLAEAGHPNGQGLKPLHVLVPNNFEDIVNFIASELQEVGITLKLELIQPNVLKQQMSRSKAVMFRAQWLADYPDAETYMVFFNSHFPAPPNYTRFSDPLFDRWYDQSLNLPDTARWQLYRRMDSLAMSYAPVIPLYYENLLHLTQLNVTGLRSNPMNIIDLKMANKY